MDLALLRETLVYQEPNVGCSGHFWTQIVCFNPHSVSHKLRLFGKNAIWHHFTNVKWAGSLLDQTIWVSEVHYGKKHNLIFCQENDIQ